MKTKQFYRMFFKNLKIIGKTSIKYCMERKPIRGDMSTPKKSGTMPRKILKNGSVTLDKPDQGRS
jgi:hypothetical protein